MLDLIYVHIDVTSNAVLSKGITHSDFVRSIVHHPQNLLLLDPSAEAGEYDMHSGLKIIRGEESVNRYFQSLQRRWMTEEIKWIDFSDVTMLKELTPLEISELLYFGHMKNSLHSPFFYKLQNDFVFFEFADQMTRVVLEKVNQKKAFFKRNTPVEKLSPELLKNMKGILQEGVIFCFQQTEVDKEEYRIPIYLVEDSLSKMKNTSYQKEEILATLVYNSEKRIWHIEQENDFGEIFMLAHEG